MSCFTENVDVNVYICMASRTD